MVLCYSAQAPNWLMGRTWQFSIVDIAEIHAESPTPYQAAMDEMRAREMLYGTQWFQRNAELAHAFFEMKRPWYL